MAGKSKTGDDGKVAALERDIAQRNETIGNLQLEIKRLNDRLLEAQVRHKQEQVRLASNMADQCAAMFHQMIRGITHRIADDTLDRLASRPYSDQAPDGKREKQD